MTNKEKFIEYCKTSDMIEMGGMLMKYLPASNELSYRILGEYNYISLGDLEEDSFIIDNGNFCLKKPFVLYRFNFYKLRELC